MARVTMRAALFAALLSVALLPGLEAATKKKVPTPRPVTVSSGDLVFTTASPPTITARSSKGATRGSVRLGTTAKIGSALLTAVSPSGKLAAVLSVGASDGATYVTLVQLKPTLKLIGSAAVPGFGTFANPPAAPFWEAGGFLLAVGDFSKRGLATLFLDAVAPDTNCSGVWANTATFDRSRLKISKFQSKTQIASFGTTCPVVNPPLPTLVRSSGLIGSSLSSLYIIQNLNSEDILVQNIIQRPDRSGKLTAVFSAMSNSVGNCFMYAVADSKNFYGACEVDSKLSVQLARFTKGKAPVKITKGNLEAGGGNFRFMATSPKNPNLWAAISRPNKRGKAQPDLIAPISKSNGKMGRTFDVPGGYANLNVVP